jgi:transposase
MFYDELNNDEWLLLAPLVSEEPAVRLNRRGRPRAEPRVVTNAVLWILTTGEPWSKLPGRYPSGPTCRRRFEEWQLNGTLMEMVRLLSQGGRTFIYIPEPSTAVARPAPEPAEIQRPRDDMLRGVFWRSPEAWQTPDASGSASRHREHDTHEWLAVDPFARITRQLAGPDAGSPGDAGPAARMDVGALCRPERRPGPAPTSHQASRGMRVANRQGYVVCVMAQSVQNAMFRAWAEILKDGDRVERSGLIGPRFDNAEAAQQFAFDWANQWIDRACLTIAAAGHATSAGTDLTAVSVPVDEPDLMDAPVSRPMPAPRPMSEPAGAASSVSVNPAGVHMNAHVNEHLRNAQVTASARRLPRRYPAEGVADSTCATDRFPAYPGLTSHAG